MLNQVTSMIDKGHDVRIYSWGKGDSSCNHQDISKYRLLEQTWHIDKKIPQPHAKRLLYILPTIIRLITRYGFSVLRLAMPRYGHDLHSRNLMQFFIASKFLDTDWKPDVVISHFGDNGIMMTAMRYAGIIPKSTKCYTFFHAHEICRMTVEQTRQFYKPMFNNHDILLPISRYWEKKLIAAGANPNNVKVIRMGVDLQRFRYNEDNCIGDTLNILSVGRLVGQKGYEYAIKGVAEYAKVARKKIRYNIIGKGELDKSLKTLVDELGAGEYIHFLGVQPQQVVADELQKANVFLLPSVTDDQGYMEGIPVARMEAMSRGLACISTYHSGIPELIDDGKTGFLCAEKNATEIAQALTTLERLSQQELDTIRRAARAVVESDFDVNKETQKLQKLVEINE